MPRPIIKITYSKHLRTLILCSELHKVEMVSIREVERMVSRLRLC